MVQADQRVQADTYRGKKNRRSGEETGGLGRLCCLVVEISDPEPLGETVLRNRQKIPTASTMANRRFEKITSKAIFVTICINFCVS
ncbi:MAG TPA: hypothetical protein DHU16_09565 [Gammaproteobacteria bacterium]|nr:hypothetical protein [Gammaproteobacteria bacterium]